MTFTVRTKYILFGYDLHAVVQSINDRKQSDFSGLLARNTSGIIFEDRPVTIPL